MPVTFTVVNGGGNFAGQPSTTVTTDSDGRAAATLTLGFQEGNSNNLVTATFPGNTAFPASFTASGLGPGNPNATVISGVVLDNSNNPIAGATVRALLDTTLYSNPSSAQTAASVQTDATGHFSIYKAPVGYVKLFVDGSTSTTAGPFPILEYDMVTVAGQVNTVNRPIFLVALKTSNQLCLTDTTGGGTLTIPDAPGFSLTFGPGQVTFPGGSKTGCVSVTQVHPDKVPMEPAFGQQPRFIVTIQPAGAIFNPPAPITIPNVDGLKPREITEMYSYDHDVSSFVAIGTGTVSEDGQVIRSNPGVGVLKAGWHCGGNPGVSGAAAECGPCAYCDGTNCQPNPTQGNNCQNQCIQGGTGTCLNGHCTGPFQPPGYPCGIGGICDGMGNCTFPGGGSCGNCNSGNPCIDDSCGSNNQCVGSDNGQCQSACAGLSDGSSCTVGNLAGTCRGGYCDLCQSLSANASCTCPGGVISTCNSNGTCNCPSPIATITKIWSNQYFEASPSNFLGDGQAVGNPATGAGYDGNNEKHVVMGTQSDRFNAHFGVTVTFDPAQVLDPTRSVLASAISLNGGSDVIGRPLLGAAPGEVKFLFDTTAFSPAKQQYKIVAGYDSNNDGILQQNEITSESLPKIGDITIYPWSAAGPISVTFALLASAAKIFGSIACPLVLDNSYSPADIDCAVAGNLLYAFNTGTTPDECIPSGTIGSSLSGYMHYNVGVPFSSPSSPDIPLCKFASDSFTSEKVRNSATLAYVLSSDIDTHAQPIKQSFNYSSNQPQWFGPYTVASAAVDFSNPDVVSQLWNAVLGRTNYPSPLPMDLDLTLAFGSAQITGLTYKVSVVAIGNQLIVNQVAIQSGILNDIYNWGIDKLMVYVQANYDLNNGAGRVFASQVDFTGSPSDFSHPLP